MFQFLSIIFFLDFFSFCWVFSKVPFFLCHLYMCNVNIVTGSHKLRCSVNIMIRSVFVVELHVIIPIQQH